MYQLPYGANVIALFVFAFTSFVLVILCTFSSPFIGAINFLRLPSPTGDTTFGSFGWCSPTYCLPNQVAYEYGIQIDRALTGAMMLWPIAVILTFFTLLSILPLLFVHESRALRFVGNRTFFVFASYLAGLVVALAWFFSIYGWSIGNRAFELSNTETHLGPAIWMGLVAAIFSVAIPLLLRWPNQAWDSATTAPRGVPVPGNGYYHYKRTTREVVPR